MNFFLSAKAVLWLALLHGAVAGLDGIATKHWEHVCASCTEVYPTRSFIGRRPTWDRMAPWGAAEVGAGYLIGRELKKKHVRWWWVPQAAAIGIHAVEATRGFTVRR